MPNSVIKGAWPGNTPSSPSRPGMVTWTTVSRSTWRSGVTTINSIASGSIFFPRSTSINSLAWLKVLFRPRQALLSLRLHLLGLRQHFFNRSYHVKRLLRNIVVFSFHDFLEAAHGILDLHVLAFQSRELRRHEHRLRHEFLNAPRPRHGPLIFVRQFFDSQNRDDVLQIFVALQHRLNRTGHGIMFLS